MPKTIIKSRFQRINRISKINKKDESSEWFGDSSDDKDDESSKDDDEERILDDEDVKSSESDNDESSDDEDEDENEDEDDDEDDDDDDDDEDDDEEENSIDEGSDDESTIKDTKLVLNTIKKGLNDLVLLTRQSGNKVKRVTKKQPDIIIPNTKCSKVDDNSSTKTRRKNEKQCPDSTNRCIDDGFQKKRKTDKKPNYDRYENVFDRTQNSSAFNKIFSDYLNECLDYDSDDDYNDDDDKIIKLLNDDIECNSDDEKIFMKESYNGDKSTLLKNKSKIENVNVNNVNNEYETLTELRETLEKGLSLNPKSKALGKALKECKKDINELVKKSRNKNTSEYYELLQGCDEDKCEITYFRNRLSNNEQKTITKELKEINKHLNMDKPYKLALLQSDIPSKYKAMVLHKLNSIKKMETGGPEYYKMKNWIDTFMRIPFNIYKSLSVKFDDGEDACNDYMVNSKNVLDSCVYGHNEAKIQILQMVGQWITNPSAMGTSIAIHGPPGSGKCHGLNTPILMYDGTIKMVQDIVIGDIVMGDDSTPRNVMSLGGGTDMLFDINTSGGKYTVNSEHILCLKRDVCLSNIETYRDNNEIMYQTTNFNFNTFKYDRSNFKSIVDAEQHIKSQTVSDNVVEICVNDYLKLPNQIRKCLYGYKVGIDINNNVKLYSPYSLGLWLGSYITNTNNIPYSFKQYLKTCMELSVIDKYCEKYIKEHYNLGLNDALFNYKINGYKKFIPINYKLSSRNDRLEILAGIIDATGYLEKNRTFKIVQYESDMLTDDIIFIARSLGFPTSLTKHYNSFKKTFYEIEIRGNIGLIPITDIRNLVYTGVEYPTNSVSKDAYTLGVLLGDRTIGDNESMFHHGCSRQEKCREKFYTRYNNQKNKFSETNLIQEKHIPLQYALNDRNIRMELLAGIIDSCGYIHRRGCYRMTCFDSLLSEDIISLSHSLGFDYVHNSYDRNWKVEKIEFSGKYYTIDIDGLIDMIPVRSYRNRIVDNCNYHNSQSQSITITPKYIGRYYGFELDGNNRYILGDFSVTHNTSIVKDGISKILGREFAFIALGGSGDSSFLEGHSYTYEGSTWGKIVQIIIDSKCMNPVIYFDELDKISDSSRGQEIASILTHLTDTTQNDQFQDKFFSEISFDLSKCLFIFSYNDESKVNPILLDRMYRIQTKGYSSKEKMVIAKKYMLPKIREQVNFKEEDVIIQDDALEYLISNVKFSQNEQGVRNLKRSLEIIHTKLNLFRLVKEESSSMFGDEMELKVKFPYTVTKNSIDKLIKNIAPENTCLLNMYI
jgi:ATP-dependent Lon protease